MSERDKWRRQIVRREVRDGTMVLVLACGHYWETYERPPVKGPDPFIRSKHRQCNECRKAGEARP